jgi:hypothetical protein
MLMASGTTTGQIPGGSLVRALNALKKLGDRNGPALPFRRLFVRAGLRA